MPKFRIPNQLGVKTANKFLLPCLALLLLAVSCLVIKLIGPEHAKPPRAVVVGSDRVQVCPSVEGKANAYAGVSSGKLSLAKIGDKKTLLDSPATLAVENQPLALSDAAGIPAVGGVAQLGANSWWGNCTTVVSQAWVLFNNSYGGDILLINPANEETIVNVSIFGKDGEIISQGTSGILVGPRSSKTIPVQVFVPQEQPVGVRVFTDKGTVAVFGRTRQVTGRNFIPASELDTNLYIPGIQSGTKNSQLVITNPNRDRANVQVKLLTSNGRMVPVGGESVSVAANSSAVIDLTTGVAGQAYAIEIVSNQPVAAAATATLGTDFTVMAAVKPAEKSQQISWAAGSVMVSNPMDYEVPVTFNINGKEKTVTVKAGQTVSNEVSDKSQLITVTAPKPVLAAYNSSGSGFTAAAFQPVPESSGGIPVVLDPGIS